MQISAQASTILPEQECKFFQHPWRRCAQGHLFDRIWQFALAFFPMRKDK
jgi:hypothetical protein